MPTAQTQSVCLGNTEAKAVFVSISAQHAWMCEKSKLVRDSVMTSGALIHNRSTPYGSWRVQGKASDRDLTGPGYSEFVHYWVPFNGDFGFHDAPWQKMPYGVTGYRTLGSHGCVHLPAATMKWFYSWVKVGTLVTVSK